MTRWVRADDFHRNFRTPPLQAHGSKRILAAHPLFPLFFGCHLQEAAQFLIQLPLDPFLSEHRIGKNEGGADRSANQYSRGVHSYVRLQD